MNLDDLNKNQAQAREALFSCCGSARWVDGVMKAFPFSSVLELVKLVTGMWFDHCSEKDWLESFSHHPKIGEKNLREKFAATSTMAGEEQSGVSTATEDVIAHLAESNQEYENKFGFIFIICATGKSVGEMSVMLDNRLRNKYQDELHIAMGEQHKITIIRLKKLLNEEEWNWMHVSQLTTHVLDTSVGKPGSNLAIKLQEQINGIWITIAEGVTDADGRIGDLLAPERILRPATYQLVFETGDYFKSQQVQTFYPLVQIQFDIIDDQHYHVPLLINPFGYSTYRGS